MTADAQADLDLIHLLLAEDTAGPEERARILEVLLAVERLGPEHLPTVIKDVEGLVDPQGQAKSPM